MKTAREVEDFLGLRPENTITALKKRLGVAQLELVVLNDMNEYGELLIEKVEPRRSRRQWVLVATLLIFAYLMTSMLVHPGVRLDHLAKHISVEVQ
jgi:hypothetical protein